MNEFERRMKALFSPLSTRLSQWWGSSAKPSGRKGMENAAAKARDLRDTDAAKKAAAKISDLRETDAAKTAQAKLADLRDTDTARKAEAKLADLRQREPVKKAEESARKALSDLFSGGKGGNGSSS